MRGSPWEADGIVQVGNVNCRGGGEDKEAVFMGLVYVSAVDHLPSILRTLCAGGEFII